jgi:serine protease Do
VRDSVVRIKSLAAGGSGFCLGDPSLVATNFHVVSLAGGKPVQVFVMDYGAGDDVEIGPLLGTVVRTFPDKDLAFIRIEKPPESLIPLSVADGWLEAQEEVIAVGSPRVGNFIFHGSVTQGVVSYPRRQYNQSTFVQHTAAVNPGNSGGPLIDHFGRVIGVNTLDVDLKGVHLAIPARTLRTCWAEWQAENRPEN